MRIRIQPSLRLRSRTGFHFSVSSDPVHLKQDPRLSSYLSALPDADKDVGVHVEEGDEGQDPCGQRGVPGQGQGVPEYKCRVLPTIKPRIIMLLPFLILLLTL